MSVLRTFTRTLISFSILLALTLFVELPVLLDIILISATTAALSVRWVLTRPLLAKVLARLVLRGPIQRRLDLAPWRLVSLVPPVRIDHKISPHAL